MKIKTSELTGAALDWAVTKCEGATSPDAFDLGALSYDQLDSLVSQTEIDCEPDWTSEDMRSALLEHLEGGGNLYLPYSTDREQGGPIIEREEIGTQPVYRDGELVGWVADSKKLNPEEGMEQYGPTPLIAGLRCYVASKLGDEVDVPDDLLN